MIHMILMHLRYYCCIHNMLYVIVVSLLCYVMLCLLSQREAVISPGGTCLSRLLQEDTGNGPGEEIRRDTCEQTASGERSHS